MGGASYTLCIYSWELIFVGVDLVGVDLMGGHPTGQIVGNITEQFVCASITQIMQKNYPIQLCQKNCSEGMRNV